jgi:hypothetical protein
MYKTHSYQENESYFLPFQIARTIPSEQKKQEKYVTNKLKYDILSLWKIINVRVDEKYI